MMVGLTLKITELQVIHLPFQHLVGMKRALNPEKMQIGLRILDSKPVAHLQLGRLGKLLDLGSRILAL
jgi:hypothetical protein